MKDYTAIGRYVLLIGIMLMLSLTANKVGKIHDLLVDTARAREVRLAKKNINTELTLPDICRPLYGNGTEDWITCMGVGYVKGN